MKREIVCNALAVILGILFFTGSAFALDPGELDPRFGSEGKVSQASGTFTSLNPFEIDSMSTGNLIVGANGDTGGFRSFVVASFLSDGTLDTSFGNSGWQNATLTSAGNTDLYGMTVTSDNKILLVGGNVSSGQNKMTMALVRLNSDGSLDSSFGEGGRKWAVANATGGIDYLQDVEIDSNSKLIGVGYSYHFVDTVGQGLLAVFDSDGTLSATKALHITGKEMYFSSLAMNSAGDIFVAGTYDVGPSKPYVCRFDRDYERNMTFGTSGELILETTLGGLSNIILLSDGNFLAVGNNQGNFYMAKFDETGSLDGTFGTGGKVSTDVGGTDSAYSVAEMSDGKIVVTGNSENQYVVVRYLSDGSVDTTFGTNGIATSSTGTSSAGEGVLQSNDNVVAVATGDNLISMASFLGQSYTPTVVPTLTEWGMIGLFLLLTGCVVYRMRKVRVA